MGQGEEHPAGLERYIPEIGVIIVYDGDVVPGLVLKDLELVIYILTQGAVSIQVIRGDVHANADIRLEVFNPLELERADLCNHKGRVGIRQGDERGRDVSPDTGIEALSLQDLMDQCGGGGLSVGAG